MKPLDDYFLDDPLTPSSILEGREYADNAPAPEFSELALADRFIDLYADKLRYVKKWDKWFHWDGVRWEDDETLFAFDLAKNVCRDAAVEAKTKDNKHGDKNAKLIATAKTRAAVVNLARDDRSIAATTEQWDSDPWLLNTPGGIVDLKTGKTRAARPGDYMTKVTAVAPNWASEPTRWLKFLDEITAGDKKLQTYLQRVAGYSLTGSTREHALFFCYGVGRNGKSVFLKVVSDILADYATNAGMETFTVSHNDRHLTELARLRGARLVTASETEQGKQWAESRIKQLTGGDKVAANFMRQDLFEYVPQFKLLIAGNHRPRLSSVDEAMRRRLHLIPFNVTISAEQCDPDLPEKLKEEWPYILNWMVEGCVDWVKGGLKPPSAVTDATAAYLEQEDALSSWLEEKCQRQPAAWESLTNLHSSWTAWALKAGETPGTAKGLSESLEKKGFTKHKRKIGQGFFGIFLTSLSSEGPSDATE